MVKVHPELNCLGRNLHDVVDRANRIMSKKGMPSGIMKFESPLTLGKQQPKQVQKRRNSKAQQESAVPSPGPVMVCIEFLSCIVFQLQIIVSNIKCVCCADG